MILKKKRREENSIVGLKGNKIFVEQPNYLLKDKVGRNSLFRCYAKRRKI